MISINTISIKTISIKTISIDMISIHEEIACPLAATF